MATTVVMEALSPTMEEGRLVEWKKQPGDAVAVGDILAEVETDKAVMELLARAAGTLLQHAVAAGTTIPVGQALAYIGAAGEVVDPLMSLVIDCTVRRVVIVAVNSETRDLLPQVDREAAVAVAAADDERVERLDPEPHLLGSVRSGGPGRGGPARSGEHSRERDNQRDSARLRTPPPGGPRPCASRLLFHHSAAVT